MEPLNTKHQTPNTNGASCGRSIGFWCLVFGVWACAGFSLSAAAPDTSKLPAAASKKIDFASDIQPIFENSCLRCHGAEKPKGKFSLVNREATLRGGENGVAIIPSDSTKSPLIHYVAGLVPDMEMPPQGKGDPLTTEQIALLRAWIDQGAEWSTDSSKPSVEVSVSPTFRWIGVSGDEKKFREHYWMKDGFGGGVENFLLRQRTNDTTITVEGRALLDEDYRVSIRYDKTDLGFVEGGYREFWKYYDDSGGFYPFAQPFYSLNRDLHLRQGKAWADFGLTLPDWPKLTLGYEYQFREGNKSTLQWGTAKTTTAPVFPPTTIDRNIFPAFKNIDEHTHILKFNASHEVAGIFIEDNFRAEFYDLNTRRVNAGTNGISAGGIPTKSIIIDEGHNQFNAVNTIHLQKEIREWWWLYGGYLYSSADADASFNQNTIHATGLPTSGDYWKSRSIVFSQDAHVFSAQTQLGPWDGVIISSGVQSEWFRQEGIGRVSLDTGNPALGLLLFPATMDANLDKHTLTENVKLSFGGIPYTTLFAEGKLEQESIGQHESQLGGFNEFVRDTDASSDSSDWRGGFYSSPLRQVSFGGHYRSRHKHTSYDHRIDSDQAGAPNESYPAFIRARTTDTDEIEAKLTLRPIGWLRATLSYQLVSTDIDSETDAIAGITPGGSLRAANVDSDVYGINFTLTPFRRWYFSGAFNYYDSRMEAAHNDVPSVVPYRGDVISALGSVTFTLSEKTDLNSSYSFSRADYAQNNFTAGLPVGIEYSRHDFRAGLRRKFKNVLASLEYGFFKYNEPSSGGFNNYEAHAVFATMTLRWP